MTITDLLATKAANQQLTQTQFSTPEALVGWFGAVQAQDFTSAKWALGLRLPHITDADIEKAYNEGTILRTHILRPTWHFVTPKDIRWMLTLTKNRVHKLNSYYYKREGLDETTLKAFTGYIATLLTQHAFLTRDELGEKLTQQFRLTKETTLLKTLVFMYAELEGIICSGPRVGKQFSYALLDKRVPQKNIPDEETALAQLTMKYFQSHGPATLLDFVWWSGLTTTDAKKGIALIQEKLNHETIDSQLYWFINTPLSHKEQTLHLLPNYDEYIVGYKNRAHIFNKSDTAKLDTRENPLFQHTMLLDGKIIGVWKREFKKDSVLLETNLFNPLTKNEEQLLQQALEHFCLFTRKTLHNKVQK